MAQVDSSLNNPNDPNNPNNTPGAVQQPGGQTNQPATTGGAGGVTATGAGNVTGQVVGTNNPSQPFQNISSYLAANAPQSQKLAGQVADTVSAPITEAQTGITNAAQDFTKSVNAGYAPENKDLASAVSTNPAYVVAENPENVTNFLGQLNDKYTGPTDFAQQPGYADLQAKIASAQTAAANTQNEAGIQSLLKGVEGPTTAGINKLDSLLLSANPENNKTIQAAGAPAADLLPSLNQTTADQNALAGTGATNASTAASNAAAALQAALSGETTNLSDQQKTIEGIVNEYNQSVGTINPVMQAIAKDIQDYLAANPNLSLADATSALGPLMNLQTLAMPNESTYASPYDYQTIAALAQLGLSPDQLSGLPINASTADLAQTFQIPGELQNAVGQAPGVESALSSELNTLGGQITGAYQPYQDLVNKETTRADLVTQAETLKTQIAQDQKTVDNLKVLATNPPKGTSPVQSQNELAAAQAKLADEQGQYKSITTNPNYATSNDWQQIAQMAQGLQWLSPASTGYNDLVKAINDQLGKLGSVGVPTLNYSPTTLTDPVTGVPIGTIGKDIGNATALGVGAGVPAAAGAGLLAAEAPTTAAALAEAGTGTAGVAPAGLTAAQLAGPAALAAYGASNIVQNSVKNPVQSGLMTLANTGLSLATLSIPPKIFESIGKDIKNVINSIGDFFGGLF